ncbi:MAG: PrgI family protein [Patescibacteria group bacterium]|nr:PrgI family protein [Patescibacteria group bacterium]
MASYKLIQDIEAEDHILGPLSLRQFIYGLCAAASFYLSFLLYTQGVPFLILLSLPPGLFCAFFAFPFGKDQSTEVWALAKLRFWFKPRKRIWDQSGVKELVTITAPKKVERILTNGLDQEQVRSRLNALANTIDSRGWAIKNINVNAYTQPDFAINTNSDRLLNASSFPQDVASISVLASDDIMDATSNPIAQQFDQMINQSAQAHRQDIVDQMSSTAPAQSQVTPADYWFMNQAPGATANAPTYQPHIELAAAKNATPEEEAIAAHAHAENLSKDVYHSHLRTLQPTAPTPVVKHASTGVVSAKDKPHTAVTPPPDPAILALANNNDLNVSTIAREASKVKGDDPSDNEVVISLR